MNKKTLVYKSLERFVIALAPRFQNPGKKGSIVEWSVEPGADKESKSLGLNKFNTTGSIIYYKDEVLK